jgi:thiol:disulfide interchange protein
MKKLSLVILWSVIMGGVLAWCASQIPVDTANTWGAVVAPNAQGAAYQVYSQEVFDAARSNGKTVVLNFRATRCPTCTEVSNDMMAKLAMLPDDVVILEVDYDIYTELKDQYWVTVQTTFVIIDENNQYQTIQTIRSTEDLLQYL